jgi:HlyD family secretion protein
MKRKWSVAIAGLALALAALLVRVAWPGPQAAALIEIRRAPAARVLAVNGNIRPRLSIDVKAPVGGTLIALPHDVGDRVTAGALLARVDDAPQRAGVAEAEAAVATQRATLAQARREQARFEALGQFATRQRVEQARLAVAEGDQELRRRIAAVAQAREVGARYTVRAPFAGIILERPVDPGQTIGIDTVIYRLADLNAPEVTAEVDEVYAAELAPGQAAFVALPAPGRCAPRSRISSPAWTRRRAPARSACGSPTHCRARRRA